MFDTKCNTIKLGFMECSRAMDLCPIGTMLVIINPFINRLYGALRGNCPWLQNCSVSLKESSCIDEYCVSTSANILPGRQKWNSFSSTLYFIICSYSNSLCPRYIWRGNARIRKMFAMDAGLGQIFKAASSYLYRINWVLQKSNFKLAFQFYD